MMDKAGKTLGDEFTTALGKLRSDAAFQDAIDAGLKRATDRFLREYADEDEDLTAALSADREFWKAKTVREALLAILRQPGRWEAKDWETVASRFDNVLPLRRNRERVDKAVRFFLRCLAEEVWHLPELKPIYEMQMQRVSLEKAETMLREVHGMRADFQQAMLALAQGIAEQKKLLASTARQACPVRHPNWKHQGCTVQMPTSIGARLRYTLDRDSELYKQVYRQRTAVERTLAPHASAGVNSQAVALGIERPHLRNGPAIANQNTLIYLLINLRFLQRLRLQLAEPD